MLVSATSIPLISNQGRTGPVPTVGVTHLPDRDIFTTSDGSTLTITRHPVAAPPPAPAAGKLRKTVLAITKGIAAVAAGAAAFGLPPLIAITHPMLGGLVGMVTTGLLAQIALPVPGTAAIGLFLGPLTALAGASFGSPAAIALGVVGGLIGPGALLGPSHG